MGESSDTPLNLEFDRSDRLLQSEREQLVILGTGPFALEVADLIEDTGRITVTAFVENWYRT